MKRRKSRDACAALRRLSNPASPPLLTRDRILNSARRSLLVVAPARRSLPRPPPAVHVDVSCYTREPDVRLYLDSCARPILPLCYPSVARRPLAATSFPARDQDRPSGVVRSEYLASEHEQSVRLYWLSTSSSVQCVSLRLEPLVSTAAVPAIRLFYPSTPKAQVLGSKLRAIVRIAQAAFALGASLEIHPIPSIGRSSVLISPLAPPAQAFWLQRLSMRVADTLQPTKYMHRCAPEPAHSIRAQRAAAPTSNAGLGSGGSGH